MPGPRPTLSLRMLVLVVAFVAFAMGWSAHWSDCKYQAVLHATLAQAGRQQTARMTRGERNQTRRMADWHAEMSRRFERAAWLPWPGSPTEPPRPD